MRTFGLLLLAGILFTKMVPVKAQPLLLDHAGTFEFVNRTDYVNTSATFTKAAITANLNELKKVVSVIQRNPVLANQVGFDCRVRIVGSVCRYSGAYAISAILKFEFASWFKNKDGKEVRNFIEPPQWSMVTNELLPICSPFSSSIFSREHGYFTVPDKKVTVEPGIDIYDGECVVIYNPERPDYWLPVTVNEAFDAVKEENERNPDSIQRFYMNQFIEQEWEAVKPEDRAKPATLSGMATRVGTLPGYPPIMKVNPAYWQKSKPVSDIQFIVFRMVGNQRFLKQQCDEFLKSNSISYHLARFEGAMSLEIIRPLSNIVK